MATDPPTRVQKTRTALGAAAVQVALLSVAVLVFAGLAFLVYERRINAGVLLFASGVLLVVVLKAFLDSV